MTQESGRVLPAFMRETMRFAPPLSNSALSTSAGYLGLAALGGFWGLAISFSGLDALFLAAAVTAAAFVLYDYRIGVVLLMILMPLSDSALFPHQMLGVTGLNPLNLLLLATLAGCLARGGPTRLSGFLPGKLLWLYIVPRATSATSRRSCSPESCTWDLIRPPATSGIWWRSRC
jgi:hypothetical protein